jgi:DNA replicative helicase MCM subunit Mcm2 (Cdc46/Mcm family)
MAVATRATPSPAELQGRWVAALEETDQRTRILELQSRFPQERSLLVPFASIEAVDAPLADQILQRPEETLELGRQAMIELIPGAGSEAEFLRLRITGLPVNVHRTIREIRESDLGRLLALDAIVRKATEVRPLIRDAAFLCLACKNEMVERQEVWSPVFQEPVECAHCGKPQGRTRFRLVPEHSTYIDSQRIEIQENPEKLKGGAHPQGLTVLLTEDLAGRVIPGNRVIVNGVLKGLQRASTSRTGVLRSTTFDLLLVGSSLEFQEIEYDEIQVTEEEEKLIQSFRGDPSVLDRIVLSLAPTIKGMEEEKEAIALQLFGGVEKHHPDGIRVRGDIHCLLVGDPGCLQGGERIALGCGTAVRIERMGTTHLETIQEQVRLGMGAGACGWATRFHRYENQPTIEVVTESGKCLRGTPNHPLLVWKPGRQGGREWKRLDELKVGDNLVVSRSIRCWKSALVPTGWKKPRIRGGGKSVRIPTHLDEEVGAILGYVLGDGWVNRVCVSYAVAPGEIDLAPTLAAYFHRKFGVVPTERVRPDGLTVSCVNRVAIASWLSFLRTKRVPEMIFASPNRVASSFLSWLYEADGTCFTAGRGRTSISLPSANIELLRDVQNLLLRWGIFSDVVWDGPPKPHLKDGKIVRGGPSGALMIRRGKSILKFAATIGFQSKKKKARLGRVVEYVGRPGVRARPGQQGERVESILPGPRSTVYDIEVPGPTRFLANGIVSHNTAKSQMLRYIADVAPRGIYTSGKGATAAGLTAAAVKDDFGGGRWVLEAGMLVLADGGMACVDELDKMTPEDRSAMHEVLEQSTVSIAKAGITATLNARCPVLAAANPKFGRFTPERTISEQIDLPPTLLSRFDVIYSIQDKPDSQKDRLLANRILQSHQEGEARDSSVLTELPPRSSDSPFSPDFLRKYISWSRKHVRPVLSDEALQVIEDFYVRIRKQGEEPNAPVPITARQLEALVRLSEASARARLSPIAEVVDAQRATRIVEGFLKRVATAEGKLDIDTVATGITHSQRERAELLMEIMRTLQDKSGSFTLEEVKAHAEKQGIQPARADALFYTYRNQGELIEIRPGTWQLVRF